MPPCHCCRHPHWLQLSGTGNAALLDPPASCDLQALRARVAELEQSVAQQREAVASEAETSRRQSAEVAAEAEAEAHPASDAHPAPSAAAPAPATPASERGLDLSVSEGVLAELRAPFEANASQFSESTWSEAVASVEAALAAGWEAQAEERAELRAAIEARKTRGWMLREMARDGATRVGAEE